MISNFSSDLKGFMNCFSEDNLVKQPQCFKWVSPTYIELIHTNQKSLLMKSCTFESGLSDYHNPKDNHDPKDNRYVKEIPKQRSTEIMIRLTKPDLKEN